MYPKLNRTIAFVLSNFGPLIVFYVVNHFMGLKPAIVCSVVFTVAEIVYRAVRKEPVTTLFKYSAVMTVAFGAVDLYAAQSILFKYEAAVTNLLTAGFFAASLFSEKSIIHDFAEKRATGVVITPAKVTYFRWLTMVWVGYLLSKVAAYIWVAQNYSLEQGLLIRTVVGSTTFYALLALSIFGSRKIFPFLQSYRLLPSDKSVETIAKA